MSFYTFEIPVIFVVYYFGLSGWRVSLANVLGGPQYKLSN
jgi:hypothetical protein